ncbi:hypothetical protein J0664_05990 [Rhizobium leguminosarum]|uniref:DUF6511 domain-containing protein n=1 Tax=Rhizobium leguminosarum TaxID=384 RepID=UPI001A9162B9|nr:DUF6511 domain-containing protein [Rhizobium leguminosarum]MBY5553739.1 hypothetical protein [Rhizobium leguminosarum]QSW24848.1 hypothetical protein J0664_05990 [Rhizobium leguminosarum]
MTKLPTGKPIIPFTPTADPAGDPTTCFCCGMRAVALGINPKPGDPQYLCRRCIVAIDDYKKIRRLDEFELDALDGGVDAVGEYIEQRGLGPDLSLYDELDQRMLVKAAWEGCARGLRAALKEAPF